ncbi:MAG TPA: aldehyde dehydrogenase family protein, partial [Xanthobacteraceae bacterium]|nr:aldehyde dehydrogenase family protein [Xanthobacteraceae bacterium]
MDVAAQVIDVRNPRTGKVDFSFTAATPEDVRRKALELRQGQTVWGALPLEERLALMRKWADSLDAHCAAIIAADSIDTGYGQISRTAPPLLAP